MTTLNNTPKWFKPTALCMAIGTALITTSSMAGVEKFTFTVNTVADVSITERQQLLFGSPMKLDATGRCGLVAPAATDDWGDVGEQTFAIPPASATSHVAAGAGCSDTAATTSNYGSYLITGGPNTTVKVTLNDGSSVDGDGNATTVFTFEPAGVLDADPTTADNGTTIANNTQKTVTLTASGEAGLIVGGDIIVGVGGLTAGQTIQGSYDIEVVY